MEKSGDREAEKKTPQRYGKRMMVPSQGRQIALEIVIQIVALYFSIPGKLMPVWSRAGKDHPCDIA